MASFCKLSINNSLGGLAKTSATSLPAAGSSRCYHPLQHIFVFGGGCTVTLSIALGRRLLQTRVQCAKHNTRLLDAKKGSTASFDWASFFHFLKPDWLPLLIAVVVSMYIYLTFFSAIHHQCNLYIMESVVSSHLIVVTSATV